MIEELTGYEYKAVESKGYSIYNEIGRKQNGDGTWSQVRKEDGKFIVTGTRVNDVGNKEEYREIYRDLQDFENGSFVHDPLI